MLRIKTAEAALRQSEERFRTMTNFTRIGNIGWGQTGIYLYFSFLRSGVRVCRPRIP